MASKQSWLKATINGAEFERTSGDQTVELSATPHTGREPRSSSITISGTGIANAKTYTVQQAPKPIHVEHGYTNRLITTTDANARDLVITFKTNAFKLQLVTMVPDKNGNLSPTDSKVNGASSATDVFGFFKVNEEYVTQYQGEYAQDATMKSLRAKGDSLRPDNSVYGDPGRYDAFTANFMVSIPANTGVAPTCYFIKIQAFGSPDSEYVEEVLRIETKSGAAFLRVYKSKGDAAEVALNSKIIDIAQDGTGGTFWVDSNTEWGIS